MAAFNPINHYEYNSDIDSLHIFGNEEGEIEGSITFENFIFDVDTLGRIIGIEIDNASKLLNVTPEFLNEHIKEAFLNVKVSSNNLFIGFTIMLQKKEFNFSYVIPRNKIVLTC